VINLALPPETFVSEFFASPNTKSIRAGVAPLNEVSLSQL
jgi:hypothetical protein